MKRQSKAEEALKKQIKILDQKLAQIEQLIRDNQRHWDTTKGIRDQLEAEVWELQKAREKASIARKP